MIAKGLDGKPKLESKNQRSRERKDQDYKEVAQCCLCAEIYNFLLLL